MRWIRRVGLRERSSSKCLQTKYEGDWPGIGDRRRDPTGLGRGLRGTERGRRTANASPKEI